MKKEDFFELATKHIVGEASEAENIIMFEQIQANSEYAAIYNELETFWVQSEYYQKEFSPDITKAFKQVVEGIQIKSEKRKRRISPSKVWQVAASIILLVGLTSLMYAKFSARLFYDQIYYSGENTKEILLPDSTKVYLNRESTLILASNFNTHKRKVKLEGEAFFNVSKDAEKPFIIKTRSTVTKVLGTSFNLKEKNETTTINVFTGKVWFSTKKHDLLLYNGEAGLFSGKTNSLIKLENSNLNSYAWFTKKLIFNDTKLNEVFETLSNTYNIVFNVSKNVNVSGIRFAGQFDQQSLDSILDILALTLNLQIDKTEDQKYMVKALK